MSIRTAAVALAVLGVSVAPAAPAQTPDSTASAADGHAWREAWRMELSRGVGTAAVWVDSLLLVASLDRNVHLVSPGEDRGTVIWDDNFRGGFEASPLVTPDRIYLPETRRGERLVALDRRDRRVLWTADAGDLASEPVARGETVFAVSSEGEVSAWGPNGTRLWRTDLDTRVVAAPVLLGDALVVAAERGTLHALDPDTGALRRTVDPQAGKIWGDPVTVTGLDGAALWATLDGQLVAVDGELEIRDRRSFPSAFYAGPSPGPEGIVYMIGHEGTAWAYDWAASEVVWRESMKGVFRAAPSVGERAIALGDLAGRLYLVDRVTGTLLWHTRLDGAITASPTARGGDFFVTTEQGTLYLFRPAG